MAPLWGVLVALAALGEGRGPPRGSPEFGEGATSPKFGGGTPGNGNGTGGGGAGAPPGGGPWNFGGSLGGSLGILGAAYLGLGGAVLLGLHLRHRALQNRKRKRRSPARRFFRTSPPEPQNPYGNLPGVRPSPPAPLPHPPEDEEGEGDEGYEEPESGSYENAPGALGGGAGPYEAMAAGEGLREPPWRGRGGEDDAASYENMEGGALG